MNTPFESRHLIPKSTLTQIVQILNLLQGSPVSLKADRTTAESLSLSEEHFHFL